MRYLLAGIKRIARGIGEMNGMPEDRMPAVNVIEGTPTTTNDAGLARRLNGVMAATLGPDNVVSFQQKGMGAENFAAFIAATAWR